MPSSLIRAELLAEISDLHRQLNDANSRAAFLGWTTEEESRKEKLLSRLADLLMELSHDISTSSGSQQECK